MGVFVIFELFVNILAYFRHFCLFVRFWLYFYIKKYRLHESKIPKLLKKQYELYEDSLKMKEDAFLEFMDIENQRGEFLKSLSTYYRQKFLQDADNREEAKQIENDTW